MNKCRMRTIVLVLKNSIDFGIRDVQLIAHHIHAKWKSKTPPRIICLWDKASKTYDLGHVQIIPLDPQYWGIIGTWTRMQLYSPKMEQYKPFLYVDLDTAVIQSLENIFDLIQDESKFITLEDFSQRDQLATGLVWFPKDCAKTQKVWGAWSSPTSRRMDYFIRKICQPDLFWQKLTNTIKDFKPLFPVKSFLTELPVETNVVCFHGKPRIFDAVNIDWVNKYVNYE